MRHLVIGYHGTDGHRWPSILRNGFKPGSTNAWFGSSIYFWEQDIAKAVYWAKDSKNPITLRAQVDLTDHCLDLTTETGINAYHSYIAELLKNPSIKENYERWTARTTEKHDAFFSDYICRLFKYKSIRALVMKGKHAYESGKFQRLRHQFSTTPSLVIVNTSLVVAVKDPSIIQGIEQVRP